MIRWLRKKLKNENGAISAFALMSMAFFVIFIVSVFVFFSRRSQSQTETLSILADKYNGKTESDMVSTLVSNEADIIPIYTIEQLYEIGTDKYITVPQESGKIYKYIYKEDATDDDSEDRAKYKLMYNWTLDELTVELKKVADSHTENLAGFSGLEVNQAKGVYIVNFPTVSKGELLVTKKIIDQSEAKGKYYNDGEKFVYEITISNVGSVDIENIEVNDLMKKISPEGKEVFESIPVYSKNNGDLTLSNKLDSTFSLKTQIQDDGSMITQKDVTYKVFYAVYTTTDDDIDNEYNLLNTVEVRGEHEGIIVRGVCESEAVIFTESPTYVKDNLVIWYDGIDNDGTQGLEERTKPSEHNSAMTTWKDKTATKTNATIKGKINSTYAWQNSKSLYFNGTKDSGESTQSNRPFLVFNNSSNNELDNVIGSLGRVSSSSTQGKDYQFSFQLVFQLKNNDIYGCLYAFGRRLDSNYCTYIKTNSSGEIIVGSDDKTATLTSLGKLVKNKKYILTMTFSYEYSSGTSANKNLKYDLAYKAYLRDVESGSEKTASGTMYRYTYLGTYTDKNLKIGFNYNVIANCFSSTENRYRNSDSFLMKMNVYSFRLYNKRLTDAEVTNNTTVDMNRFFK